MYDSVCCGWDEGSGEEEDGVEGTTRGFPGERLYQSASLGQNFPHAKEPPSEWLRSSFAVLGERRAHSAWWDRRVAVDWCFSAR